jgi:hypothetical protein
LGRNNAGIVLRVSLRLHTEYILSPKLKFIEKRTPP